MGPTSLDALIDSTQYGLAIAKCGPLYGDTGELPGYNTLVGHDPVHEVTVDVRASFNSPPAGGAIASAIARKLVGRIYVTT